MGEGDELRDVDESTAQLASYLKSKPVRAIHPLYVEELHSSPEAYENNRFNRGAAILDNRLFVGTLDAVLIALDARSGAVLWQVQMADTTRWRATN
jgi:glucose dehydrogenase